MLKHLKELICIKDQNNIYLKGNTHSDIYCNQKWYGIPVQDHDRHLEQYQKYTRRKKS